MKWPADRLYNHLPWGWSCILPCQKIPLSWLFSGPWNCRSSDHLLFKIFSQKHKKAIYIIIIWHRKITPVHSIRNFYLQKKHVFPQITESWFSNKKGWRVNLQPNHQHHKKPGYCVCVCLPPPTSRCTTLHLSGHGTNGMGLGLALVREVVRIHHGRRSVFGRSKEGFFGTPQKWWALEWGDKKLNN